MIDRKLNFRANIQAELRRLRDYAVSLAKQLGFEGGDRKILAALGAESDFYTRNLPPCDQGDLCVARRGPWTRQFSKPVVSRIYCISALEVLLNPMEMLGNGFSLLECLNEVERYLGVVRRERAAAVKVPAPPKNDIDRRALVNKAREKIRTLEQEIAVARHCACAA